MRIILALHQFLPEFRAGTEVLTHRVACGLRSRGHEILIFAGHPTTDELPDHQRFQLSEYDGFSVLTFLHQHREMAGQTDVVRQEFDSEIVRRKFKELLAEWRPSVVHFFNFARISTSPVDCCIEAGVPFFYTATDFWSVCTTARLQLESGAQCDGPSRFGANCLAHLLSIKKIPWPGFVPLEPALRTVQTLGSLLPFKNARVFRQSISIGARSEVIRSRLSRAACVWVPTETMASLLAHHGVAPLKLAKMPFGIDVTCVTRRRRERRGPLRAGFIGTIAFHKGLHNLVGALQLAEGLEVELVIYGDTNAFPDYYGQFADQIARDPRIRLGACFPPDEIDRIINQIDILVVPSLWRENAPLVVLEALARGCPVVASRQPGLVEFVRDGDNGLVFDPDSQSELISSLERLVVEDGLLGKLSDRCAASSDMELYVDEVCQSYDSACRTN